MHRNSNYRHGWAYTMKLAGLTPPGQDAPGSILGPVGGMAAGGAVGGNLAEILAKKTRKSLLGIDIPGTERVDPAIARAVGSMLGALGGGYLGYETSRKAYTNPVAYTNPLAPLESPQVTRRY